MLLASQIVPFYFISTSQKLQGLLALDQKEKSWDTRYN